MYNKRSLIIVAVVMFATGLLFAAKLDLVKESPAGEYFHEGAGQYSPPPGAPGSFSDLAKRVSPAVVNISTTKRTKVRAFNPFQGFGQREPFDDFFDKFFEGNPGMEHKQHSLGSGFVINKDGYIITNNHVVQEAEEIVVRFSDEHKYPAKIIGTDAKTDIAVIKVKTDKPLKFVSLGDSDKLDTGDWVVAIGNPFGFDHTVTAGIVSAKGRVIGAGPYDNFIQTDASINPGNSGGPLFNLAGNVVGINTAIFAGGQGLGFAIPINMAKKLIPQLVKHGKITDRGWLGVQIQVVTEELAKSFGIDREMGALVSDVVPNSPAAKAGLKTGDIILKYEGKEIYNSKEFPGMVANTQSNTVVKLDILRDGKKKTIEAKLGKMEEGAEEATKEAGESTAKEADKLGLITRALSMEEAHELGVPAGQGVLIVRVEPGSEAEYAGVRSGDILMEINSAKINSMKEYEKAIETVKKGKVARLLIRRQNSTIYVAFKVNK